MNQQETIATFVKQKMEAYGIPGVSLGILVNGEEILLQFGVASLRTRQPVVPETIFQVGSNTKTMTATLLMALHEQGELDLDQPIQSVLPEFSVKNEAVSRSATVRQLLTHSTGWVGDHFIDSGRGADAGEKYAVTMAKLPQIAPPDTAFSYNNSAFALSGVIIERITGRSYAAALRDLLFDPLGMPHSFLEAEDVMLQHFAVGHAPWLEGESKVAGPWPLPRAMYAAGSVAADAKDMLTYARFYLDGGVTSSGEQIISKEGIERLWTTQFEIKPGWSMAHSWFVTDEGGVMSYSHGGATVGQISAFKIVPDRGFAFVSLTNSFNGRLFNADLEPFLLSIFCEVEPSAAAKRPATAAEVTELVGRYERPMADLIIKIDEESGELIMQAIQKQGFPTENDPPRPPTPWMALQVLESGHLHVDNGSDGGAEAQVLRYPDGSIRWIRFGLRLHAKR
ncbi:MAG: serine hydrolase domain-containing protein [Chloroflexota bacterium]